MTLIAYKQWVRDIRISILWQTCILFTVSKIIQALTDAAVYDILNDTVCFDFELKLCLHCTLLLQQATLSIRLQGIKQ
jgi:hypothetical protein